MRFGPLLTEGGVTFRLWAPAAREVSVVLDSAVAMPKRGEWFEAHVPGAGPGTRYRFKIDGELAIPDPASHFQPQDVQGSSEVIDHHHRWICDGWRGRPWEETVFLELHIGTFTPDGTYRAAEAKLDHFVDTGITAIELMPLADFPGRWNWGYDGVLLYAPDSSYGRPDDLKQFIDAAHQRRLMVFLDVVYNHFGPEGNYLRRIAPQFFSNEKTPWGDAINYDIPQVRQFAVENAVYWLSEYRFDGLRLDAVHTIATPGKPHILQDLSLAVGALARDTGRQIHLVLENYDNRSSLLAPSEEPLHGHYRAQWNDDYHHAWHVLLTGERHGYYKDYCAAGPLIARSLAEGFSYQGEPSTHRQGARRGESTADLPPMAFVIFVQNHDQIGNRALSDRLTVQASPCALQAAHCVLLLAPSPPLLFMGEEWGATEPFPFFCDFRGGLAEAVRRGRHIEFAEAYADPLIDVPDPLAKETRDSAVLDWRILNNVQPRKHLDLIRSLLRTRREKISPIMPSMKGGEAKASYIDGLLRAYWPAANKTLRLVANLSDRPLAFATPNNWGEPVWGGAPPAPLPAWSVYAAIASG
jgi:malto-oligosyltrehalose trehalohydrolase